ncbi:uncharacterized protein LOC124925641 [Impatiens glandulifera]|uniref:uncharacterized protein LOC124925641 n=1 Tax=Impatiens glandulifera TaxID=253017 RepID=UPI001FB13419|nr:uncharacterized protein LOC124925641 [Impatiens glandulifera]
MEIKGRFLPQFKVRQPPLITTWLLPNKRFRRRPLLVLNMFREVTPGSTYRWKSLEVHSDNNQNIRMPAVSKQDSSKPIELSFNRLQLTDQECYGLQKRSFGRFVAREAVLDEEYWTAAWLRAEAHWESMSYIRHMDNFKRKYAEQEFYALKRRCSGQDGNSLRCFCFVAVKKEDKNIRRTVLNSVVGTLDLSVRQLLQGERYPGEVKRVSAILASQVHYGTHQYAYIANVCVSKFARRQGIASNMLQFATDVANLAGMRKLFVHVNVENEAAQELYKKTGFKVVEAASSTLSKDQRLLMAMEL